MLPGIDDEYVPNAVVGLVTVPFFLTVPIPMPVCALSLPEPVIPDRVPPCCDARLSLEPIFGIPGLLCFVALVKPEYPTVFAVREGVALATVLCLLCPYIAAEFFTALPILLPANGVVIVDAAFVCARGLPNRAVLVDF